MAFDGITTCAVVRELRDLLPDGRIDKIYQPDADTVVLGIRNAGRSVRLLMTAQARCPRLHLTEERPENPLTPPMFCMLLRKHIAGGRITGISQYQMDRIVTLSVEAVNEMGDRVEKRLILEMMGRHSNLFLLDEQGVIVDAIRHVTPAMSSVRTVLPGLPYSLPTHNSKQNPLDILDEEALFRTLSLAPGPVGESICRSLNGISPFMAGEILFRAGIDERETVSLLPEDARKRLYEAFRSVFSELTRMDFCYRIFVNGGRMEEFAVLPSRRMEGADFLSFETVSSLLDAFYQKQDRQNRIQQKAQDLRRLIATNLDRARRKEALQEKQLADAENRENDRLAGELITANIYQLTKGMTEAVLPNFYEEDTPPVTVRLDADKTPAQNAQRYFSRYNKAKRAEVALRVQLASTREEIEYLESVEAALALSEQEKDLETLRLELHEAGYIRRLRGPKKPAPASKPLSFTTSEGVRIQIGKNNLQNDQLTFRAAAPDDLWLHVKNIPGSHTILFVAGLKEGTDYTEASIREAAVFAAAHSKAAGSSSVPVDYTQRRYVKKPAGARPGFVVYTHQKTLYVTP